MLCWNLCHLIKLIVYDDPAVSPLCSRNFDGQEQPVSFFISFFSFSRIFTKLTNLRRLREAQFPHIDKYPSHFWLCVFAAVAHQYSLLQKQKAALPASVPFVSVFFGWYWLGPWTPGFIPIFISVFSNVFFLYLGLGNFPCPVCELTNLFFCLLKCIFDPGDFFLSFYLLHLSAPKFLFKLLSLY